MNYALALDTHNTGSTYPFKQTGNNAKVSGPRNRVIHNSALYYNKGRQETEDRFNKLVEKWTNDVRNLSSPTARVAHPDYLTIASIGPPAIPLLLRELQKRPNFWFAALRSILEAQGEKINPVADTDRGNMRKMCDAWIRWGEAEGYI